MEFEIFSLNTKFSKMQKGVSEIEEIIILALLEFSQTLAEVIYIIRLNKSYFSGLQKQTS